MGTTNTDLFSVGFIIFYLFAVFIYIIPLQKVELMEKLHSRSSKKVHG